MSSNSAKERERKWRWLLKSTVALALIGAILVGSVFYRRHSEFEQGRAELAAAVAEAEAADPGWTWDAIVANRPSVPHGENAADVIEEVTNLIVDLGSVQEDYEAGQSYSAGSLSNRRLHDASLAIIRTALEHNDDAAQRAATLSRYTRGRFNVLPAPDLISTQLPHLDPCLFVLRLLVFDSERLLHSENPKLALDRIEAMRAISSTLRDEPFGSSQFIRTRARKAIALRTERLMGMQELPDSVCADLLKLMQLEAAENLLLTAVRGERAGRHYFFEGLESGRIDLPRFLATYRAMGGMREILLDRFAIWRYECWLRDDHAKSLRLFNDAERIALLPIEQRSVAWTKFEDTYATDRIVGHREKRWLLTTNLMLNATSVCQEAVRDQSVLRCAIAGLAAERFRIANRRWPASMDELSPTFLPQVLVDAYDGKPLVIKRREDGLTIHAIGLERKLYVAEIEPSLHLGYPIFQLWNPDQRRLSAVKIDED